MYKSIKASELKFLIGKVNIIDIRKNFVFNLGNIPGSKNVPMAFLMSDPGKYLKKEEEYYIYCMQGFESIKVCDKLVKKGYKVVNVLGGYHDYLTG